MLNGNDLEIVKTSLPFVSHLDKAGQELVAQACTMAAFAPGEIILNKETDCNGVVIVKSGQLRACYETEDGKQITLYRLLEGDVCILTASCVLKNITFEVTLEAEKAGEVIFLPAAVWSRLLQQSEEARALSSELLGERFSEVMWVMEQMVSKNMGQRVAAFLLEQSVLENSMSFSMTHETIAKNLGTAREVVSRTLKYLENDGLLQLSRGKIALTDMKKLRELSR